MSVIKYDSKTKLDGNTVYACGKDGIFYRPIYAEDGIYVHAGSKILPLCSPKLTDEALEVLLFNTVAFDNYNSPFKNGVYKMQATQLKDAFSDAMYKVEAGKMDAKAFRNHFSLVGKDERVQKNLNIITNYVVPKLAKVKTEEAAL